MLVDDALTDAVADADAAALEFQHTDRYAVEVEHDVGALPLVAQDGDLLGDGELIQVTLVFVPIDEMHPLVLLSGIGNLGAGAQHFIDFLVVALEVAIVAAGFFLQLVDGPVGVFRRVTRIFGKIPS